MRDSSFAAIILKSMYGIDITPEDPKYVPLLHGALEAPTEALLPGSFLVENIPVLQYVPAWVPGAGFQKKFARWRLLVADMLNRPFADAKLAWLRLLAAFTPASAVHLALSSDVAITQVARRRLSFSCP